MKTTMREETITGSGKTQGEKSSGHENHFRRLPEELFLFILTIVADLKSLCKCSLVSKHFASVVFRIRTVCLTIPSSGVHSMESFKSLWALPKPKPLVFLEQFKELESIYLEYKYPEDSANSSCTKWKVKFSTNFPSVERLVALLPASAHKQTSYEPHQEQVSQQNNTDLRFKWRDCYWLSYARFVEWMFVVSILGQSHTSLKRATVTDSEKQGRMVICEEQFVRIRSVRALVMFQPPPSVEIASILVLQLPLSGYVMERVLLVIFNYSTESRASAIDEIVSWDFEDEEKVLSEAIKEIYKNHSAKIEKMY